MQLLNSKILSNDKNTRYSNKKAQDTRVTCAFLSVVAFSYYKDGGDAGFVANIVCVITERKCLHFKAECQPGYRGSHGDAVLRFFKIAINPRIDDIEKQVEQEVQLVSRLVEMRGFVANIVCVITERKCFHFKAECQPGYRGSRCKATARLLPCEIPASE